MALKQADATLFSFFLSSLLSILLIFSLKRRRRSKKPNLPPCPPKLPFIGNLHQIIGQLPHRSFRALSQKYGPLMWLQLGHSPTLVISSPDIAKEIITTHDLAFANRPQNKAANIILYGCKDVAFANYSKDWKQKKKICFLELLSRKSVQSLKHVMEEESRDLVRELRKSCGGGGINMTEKLTESSNNITCRCFYGKKYNAEDSDGKFRELARKALAQIRTFCVGDAFPWLGWIDSMTGLVREFRTTSRGMDALLDQVIAEHKKEGNGEGSGVGKKKDFVDILLQLQESGTLDFELTLQDIKAILVVCLFKTLLSLGRIITC